MPREELVPKIPARKKKKNYMRRLNPKSLNTREIRRILEEYDKERKKKMYKQVPKRPEWSEFV